MSALSTSATRDDRAATTSTARLTTAITSSQSPSMLVNIALVSCGSPDSRTTWIAAATASDTPPRSSPPDGLMLKATITPPSCRRRRSCLLYTSDAADEEDSVDLGGRRIIKKKNLHAMPFM